LDTIELILTLLGAASVPSTIFACYMRKLEKKREREEQARRQYEGYLIKMQTATTGLCEAIATAMQNGRCNGETHAALERLEKVKHDQRDFLVSQGLDHLF
jgi:hypothetical protein